MKLRIVQGNKNINRLSIVRGTRLPVKSNNDTGITRFPIVNGTRLPITRLPIVQGNNDITRLPIVQVV